MPYANNPKSQRIDERRLPIVFLLDVSGSMLYDNKHHQMQLAEMNQFVQDFIEFCMNHDEAPKCTDMCFVLFTDEIILTTDFYDMNDLGNHVLPKTHHPACGKIRWIRSNPVRGRVIPIPQFPISEYDNGTNIGKAVLHGIHVIDQRIHESGGFTPYPPILVLASDGHLPAKNQRGAGDDLATQQMAIEALRARDYTTKDECNLIIPLVVPIGAQRNETRLKEYLGDFDAGYIPYSEYGKDAGMALVGRVLKYSMSSSTNRASLADITSSKSHNAI